MSKSRFVESPVHYSESRLLIIFTERESRRSPVVRGWSGGAMVLGKLSGPRCPTNFDNSREGPIALAIGAGWGCSDIFLSSVFPFSLFGRQPYID